MKHLLLALALLIAAAPMTESFANDKPKIGSEKISKAERKANREARKAAKKAKREARKAERQAKKDAAAAANPVVQ